MKIQYISSVMHSDDFAELFAHTKEIPGQQVQKYHRLLIEGISKNNIPVRVISSVPVTPQNYPHKWYKGKHHYVEDIEYKYLPVFNCPSIKAFMQMIGAFLTIACVSNKKEQVLVCDVLNASVSRGASVAAKLFHIPCVGIITDLPDMMVTGGSPRYVNMVNKNIANCTHYVLLTEKMNEVVNPACKPYTIIEGLCDVRMQQVLTPTHKENKTCLYAGLLDERYGVKKMVEAFVLADIPGAQFHIYGNGSYAEELSQVAKKHSNIVFHGSVLNDEVVQAELNASLLVNPRPTTEEFTKYSFPSKNMEYMASGTPVLTTNLPGMPKEYQNYVFLFNDETVEGMADTFTRVLGLSENELEAVGKSAKAFVTEQKNNMVQCRKIMELFL